MARYLMTHSLLSSWLYSMRSNPNENSTTERDRYEEFLKVLRREPTEQTEAMQKGIAFENLVTDILLGRGDRTNKWWDAAQKVACRICGGRLQLVAKKEVVIDDLTFLLYGRLDCLHAGTVYDIKFTANPSNYYHGKYIDSTQHPMYLELVPEAKEFTYLISSGTDVWTETYRRDETNSIVSIIRQFVSDLKASGLIDVYKEKWLAA